MATSEPVIDPAAVMMLADSLDAESATALVDVFLEESPELVEEIRRGVLDANADSARRAAHTLKSNCRTFGLNHLASLCQELEALAATGAMGQPGVDRIAQEVVASYPAARSALAEQRRLLAQI